MRPALAARTSAGAAQRRATWFLQGRVLRADRHLGGHGQVPQPQAVHPPQPARDRRRVAGEPRRLVVLPRSTHRGRSWRDSDRCDCRDPGRRRGRPLGPPARDAAAVRHRRQLDPDHRLRADLQQLVRLDTQLSKAMIAAVLVFFPVMINTLRGLLNVDPSQRWSSCALRHPRADRLPPAAAPNCPAVHLHRRYASRPPWRPSAPSSASTSAPCAEPRPVHRHAVGLPGVRAIRAAIIFAAAIGIGLYIAVVVA